MQRPKPVYYFLLYREYQTLGAISNDIIRRAMGVAIYGDTTIVLIECSKEFQVHVRDYTKGSSLKVLCLSLDEAKILFTTDKGNVVITHTWPQTLYASAHHFEQSYLILIEEIAPLWDRLPKPMPGYSAIKRKLVDRILTRRSVMALLLNRYRRAVRKASLYVAISDIESDLIIRHYGLKPNFTSYEPVDDRFFKYVQSERHSIIVFGDMKDKISIIKILLDQRELKLNEIINFNPSMKKEEITFPGVNITVIENYSFEDIEECYKRTYISITSEYKGSFELIPIESIMSGVPIISPIVPSLSILRNIYIESDKADVCELPFFDYFSLNKIEADPKLMKTFEKWVTSLNILRQNCAYYSSKIFSIPVIAQNFIRNVESRYESANQDNVH
ncbi:MAG: glycosyltransferase family protein [Thermoplasmataceae archaeon]